MNRTSITPETKVGELLDAYPELEVVLIAMAPAFAKLRNPILRRTVARVASLGQAARIGGIEPRELVRRLRQGAGLDTAESPPSGQTSDVAQTEQEPAWVGTHRTVARFDADAMLAAEQQPIGKIVPRASALTAYEKMEITATFDPVPLTDLLISQGYPVFTRQLGGGTTLTYVGPRRRSTTDPLGSGD